MNTNERFGQIEMMLADMLRRMDRQSEQMDRQSGQIDDIINILKISDARQTEAEKRQDAMLAEIRQQGQQIDKQGQQIDKQGQQIDKQGQQIDKQGQQIDKKGQQIDTMLQSQMQMLELMSRNAKRTDALEYESKTFASYESRFRRLEEVVFKRAS